MIKRQREQQAFLPEWTPQESDQNITYLNPDNPSATRVPFLTLKKKYSISSSRTDKKSPTSQRRRPEQSITGTINLCLSQKKDSSKYSPNQSPYQTQFTWSWFSTRHLVHLVVVPVPSHPQERLALEKKELDAEHGEIKSMHTLRAARGRGVGQVLLDHLIVTARKRGYKRLSLETGTMKEFEAARRRYQRNGFSDCQPLADYFDSDERVCMTKAL